MRPRVWIGCSVLILMVVAGVLLVNRPTTKDITTGSRQVSPTVRSGDATSPSRVDNVTAASGTGPAAGDAAPNKPGNGPAWPTPSTASAQSNGRGAHVASQVPAQIASPTVVSAMVRVGGQTLQGDANELGIFPEIRVQPGQQVGVTVAYPEGQPGQRIVAAVEDGGLLQDGERVLPMQLDSQQAVTFNFTAGEARGIYRVTLRRGTETKMLQFWAGEPLPLAMR